LIAWVKEKREQEQKEKCKNSTTTMKERKPHHIMNTNTRYGYAKGTCAVNLTTDHILWHCKETETKRLQMDIGKEIWKSEGKADQIRERNKIFRRNIKKKQKSF
jgi:hypothetical protein